MNILNKIQIAENTYVNLLEEFFLELWGETLLYSHDLNHHSRVWHYAKELLLCNEKAITAYTSNFCNKLLIACYLHDIGMSVNPGINHGVQSREICKAFLLKNNFNESDFSDVLEAVEHHDDKEYKNQGYINNEVLKLLSIADDLDAFGYIGIYRYLEIYIARGIRPEILGHEIRKNALKRFQNFELNFGYFPELFERHRNRFRILDDFFAGYNIESGYIN